MMMHRDQDSVDTMAVYSSQQYEVRIQLDSVEMPDERRDDVDTNLDKCANVVR